MFIWFILVRISPKDLFNKKVINQTVHYGLQNKEVRQSPVDVLGVGKRHQKLLLLHLISHSSQVSIKSKCQ